MLRSMKKLVLVTILLLMMYVLVKQSGQRMDREREDYIRIFDENCIEEKSWCFNLSMVRAPICVHEKDLVLASLTSEGAWEESSIRMFIQLLKAYPAANFVDIGVNLGIYSIVAATFGRQVIAVDPGFKNLCRLRKSLILGNLYEYAILLLNGVSKERGMAKLAEKSLQKGLQEIQAVDSTEADGSHNYMKTILLEDLVKVAKFQSAIFRVDIEGHEWYLLDHISAIIDTINITVFIFEIHYRHSLFEIMCPRLYEMMASKGYEPYDDPINRVNKNDETCTGNKNVFWVKQF